MAYHGKKHVVTCPAIILWDGITKPEVDQVDGSLTHTLKIAIPNNAPELAEITQIATNALNESKWKGAMPPGGNWPLVAADVSKFGPLLAGHTCFSVKTRRGAPEVYDANGVVLSPIVYGRQLYPGSKVSVYMHAYDYDNKQKGIAFGVDGVKIVDSTAPALAVGGGVSPMEVAAAFAQTSGAAAGPIMIGGADYNVYKNAGWSDQQMIDGGHMQRPVAAPPAPPAPLAPPPLPGASVAPPPPPAPIAPAAPGRVMLPAANGTTYDQYVAAGWSDAQMVAGGVMAA